MPPPGTAAAPSSADAPARIARRQQLIDAAIASISEHSLSRTTVSKVAEAAAKPERQPHVDPAALGTAFFHLLDSIPDPFDPLERYDLEGAKRTCRAFLASVFPATFALANGARRSRRRGAQ